MDKNLVVKVLDIKNGLQIYNKIKFIRILSEKYNLLIMRDYLPIIGEINGNVEIQGEEYLKLENIKGFYINRANEFSIIIKGDL